MSWAQLLTRVFAIDITTCPQCGGELTLIAAIEDPAVIRKILTHLGLPTRNGIRLRNRHHSLKDLSAFVKKPASIRLQPS